MKCQNCGVNNATTSIKTNLGGKQSHYLLCSDCAAKLGFEHMNPFGSFAFDSFLGSLMTGQTKAQHPVKRCPGCGLSMGEIAEGSKVGCAECYTAFREQLLPSIESIHGKVRHAGRIPAQAAKAAAESESMSALKMQLKAAVDSENFEEAAALRDQIKAREGETNGQQ